MKAAGLLLAGWVAWTLSEYALHRWAMHGIRGILSRQHRRHHAQPGNVHWTDTLATLSRVVLIPAAIGGLASRFVAGGGLVFLGGWTAGYVVYEVCHWRSHDHEPVPGIRRYDLWLRRRHLHHHFGHSMANYGLTVDLWDRLFGTLEATGRVQVPRRLVPRWLLGDDGELRAEYRTYYELGRAS